MKCKREWEVIRTGGWLVLARRRDSSPPLQMPRQAQHERFVPARRARNDGWAGGGAVSERQAKVMRRRETYEDVMRADVWPLE